MLANKLLHNVGFIQICLYHFYSPHVICLINVMEMNLQPSWFVDSSKTVTADFHQASNHTPPNPL